MYDFGTRRPTGESERRVNTVDSTNVNPFEFESNDFDTGFDEEDFNSSFFGAKAPKKSLAEKWNEALQNLKKLSFIFRGKHEFPNCKSESPYPLECSTCKGSEFGCKAKITLYFFFGVKEVEIKYCTCYSLPEALVLMGLFPSSPERPQSAFCFGLLEFFKKVKRNLKTSSQSIADLYNDLQGTPKKALDDNLCRSVMYLYEEFGLKVEEELNEKAGVADLVMTCSACLKEKVTDDKDRLFLTMDGNFSQKCKREFTVDEKANPVPLINGMWIKKEIVESTEHAAPSSCLEILRPLCA